MTRDLHLAPANLGILADPIVKRALVLLLRSPRYDARFLPTSSSDVTEALDGVQLVLLGPTPQLSAMRREMLVASLVAKTLVAGIPILELVVPSGRVSAGEGRVGAKRREVSWPCSVEELERGIEDVLCPHHETYPGTHRHSPPRNR